MNNEIRVIHIIRNLKKGVGVYHSVRNLAQGQSQDVAFALYIPPIGITLRDRLEDFESPSRGVALVSDGIRGFIAVFLNRNRQKTVLHFHNKPGTLLCLAAKIFGVKTVRTVRYVGDSRSVLHGRSKASPFRRLFNNLRIWLVDHWVAISEHGKDYVMFRFNVPDSRLSLIYNGVDTEFFSPSGGGEPSNTRRALGIDCKDIVFVNIGTLSPRKRQVELIMALGELLKRGANATLCLVGPGDQEPFLEVARSLGIQRRVLFLGERSHDEIKDILRASDVLVHAAIDEAFGLVVAEAQSMGLPAIVMEGSGPSEIVEDGVTGKIVRDSSLRSLASSMGDLASDPDLRKRMGLAARQRMIANFSLSRMNSSYFKIYRELLDQGSGRQSGSF